MKRIDPGIIVVACIVIVLIGTGLLLIFGKHCVSWRTGTYRCDTIYTTTDYGNGIVVTVPIENCGTPMICTEYSK